MDPCIFCNREKIAEDILYESSNFFVKVGFSIYAPGQLMLVSNEHYNCFAELSDNLETEKSHLENLLTEKISHAFFEPFQVEMGNWGQSVKYAHTHFVPLKSNFPGSCYHIKNVLQEMINQQDGSRIVYEEASLSRLKEIFRD